MSIYLDHAATTPLRREAFEAMVPFLTETYGNPSSAHAEGRRARAALDEAHERVAACLGAEPREIVFTSGGTEATNLGLKGAAWAAKARGNQLITSAVEHHATLHTLQHLEKFGFEVVVLPVDRYGRVDPDQLEGALSERTTLVSLIHANNEVGTVLGLEELIARVRRHKGILVHLDAVQAAAYLALDLHGLDVDLVSLSAHKFEGPKGIGALFVRRGTTLLAQSHGGTQERYRRAGTENVAGAVGMAAALELARDERPATVAHVRQLRERLQQALLTVPGVELTGHPRHRLPGLLSVIVREVEGVEAQMALDLEGIACSPGAACTTGSAEPSHVLGAMGYPEEEARGALRFSLGRTSTAEEVAQAASVIPGVIARLREGGSTAPPSSQAGLEVGA